MGNLTKERLLKVAIVLIAAFFISKALILLFDKNFDSTNWKNLPQERYKMLDDILENKYLMGKTKQDVISILGTPDKKFISEDDFYIYNLGNPPSFFDSTPQYLLVTFENEIVVKLSKAID